MIIIIPFLIVASNIEELKPGKLEIRNAQQEDEGMYRCVVKNKYGSETRYFRLNVIIRKSGKYTASFPALLPLRVKLMRFEKFHEV